MSRARIFEWHRRFREGEEDVEDKPRSGRPSSSKTDENVEAVRQAVRGDRCLTVRMIAEQVGIDRQTVWQIITVFEELSTTNRQSTCLPVCAEKFARRSRHDLFDSNTWLFHHDNAPAHSALSLPHFLAEKNVPVLDQPP